MIGKAGWQSEEAYQINLVRPMWAAPITPKITWHQILWLDEVEKCKILSEKQSSKLFFFYLQDDVGGFLSQVHVGNQKRSSFLFPLEFPVSSLSFPDFFCLLFSLFRLFLSSSSSSSCSSPVKPSRWGLSTTRSTRRTKPSTLRSGSLAWWRATTPKVRKVVSLVTPRHPRESAAASADAACSRHMKEILNLSSPPDVSLLWPRTCSRLWIISSHHIRHATSYINMCVCVLLLFFMCVCTYVTMVFVYHACIHHLPLCVRVCTCVSHTGRA